ncbi:hypothetical protein C8Q73DRAFT_327524 [Cubamyces lactineus]|nr:hypothetical protein C8Q73DRAFT_327524 [Cubamyces lactineus]
MHAVMRRVAARTTDHRRPRWKHGGSCRCQTPVSRLELHRVCFDECPCRVIVLRRRAKKRRERQMSVTVGVRTLSTYAFASYEVLGFLDFPSPVTAFLGDQRRWLPWCTLRRAMSRTRKIFGCAQTSVRLAWSEKQQTVAHGEEKGTGKTQAKKAPDRAPLWPREYGPAKW